jgi:hypothetical protein
MEIDLGFHNTGHYITIANRVIKDNQEGKHNATMNSKVETRILGRMHQGLP